MEEILDRLERRRREDSSCEAFFTPDGAEPFFVKNLENVQGDERDVILISIGYGRTAEGTVAMSFGPLNSEGGERRLNVLITRARVRCEVFTNLKAADIDLGRTQARGVRALKTFLAFAETGSLETLGGTAAGAVPPFASVVRETLASAGWDVRAGVGPASCAIGLGVREPDRPGRYRLGVECDGFGALAGHSARDRDRLRPTVLEGLGWRLERALSAGWFRDAEGAKSRLLEAIEESSVPARPAVVPPPEPDATAPTDESDADESDADAVDDPGAASLTLPPSGAPAYELARLVVKRDDRELHQLPPGRLEALVTRVVRTEGPVHAEEVVRRVSDAAGVKRLGSRIQASLDEAIERAVSTGEIDRRGAFLWESNRLVATVRDRSGLAPAMRKLDLVAPEEITEAVVRVAENSLGIEPAAVPLAVCRLLGFPRMTDEMRIRIEATVREVTESGRLVTQGAHLVVSTARKEPA
jgi:hypothetical protein